MSHECDDCGQTFETLTRLRLHDCSSDGSSEADATETPTTDESDVDVVDNRPDRVDIDEEDQEECKVVVKADDDREEKQAGNRCGNVENVSNGVCSECRSE